MGLMGLGDPVVNLGARDAWIGWNREFRNSRLRYVVDAYALGAVEPYSRMLGGKLVASLVRADEVQQAFRNKYEERPSLISGRRYDGTLAMVTTTSALGRSSLYNRLRLPGEQLFVSVGFTKGYGDFHFLNGTLDTLRDVARATERGKTKHASWGTGFRNRREIVKRALPALGLPHELLRHGIAREVFCVPLATNSKEFLAGADDRLQAKQPLSATDISEFMLQRWVIPRAGRDGSYVNFDRTTLALWPNG